MYRNDISIAAVKGARNVQRLPVYVSHEQGFGVGLVVRILLYDVTPGDHILDIGVGDLTQAHTLLGVLGDEIAIFLHCLAPRRCRVGACVFNYANPDRTNSASGSGSRPIKRRYNSAGSSLSPFDRILLRNSSPPSR